MIFTAAFISLFFYLDRKGKKLKGPGSFLNSHSLIAAPESVSKGSNTGRWQINDEKEHLPSRLKTTA